MDGGEEADSQIVVAFQLVDHCLQLRGELWVDRVPRFGSVERDDPDVFVAFEADDVSEHRPSSSAAAERRDEVVDIDEEAGGGVVLDDLDVLAVEGVVLAGHLVLDPVAGERFGS